MIINDKGIEIFYIIDEFCNNFASECEKNLILKDEEQRHHNHKGRSSHSEIMTIIITPGPQKIIFRIIIFHNFVKISEKLSTAVFVYLCKNELARIGCTNARVAAAQKIAKFRSVKKRPNGAKGIL